MSILDFLFPKYCISCRNLGSYICADCFARLSFSQKAICYMCGTYASDGLTHQMCSSTSSLDGCFISMEYTHVVKRLIYVFKHNPYVRDVHTVIDELLYEGLIQKEALLQILSVVRERVMVPIPLHTQKLRSRGYNHAAVLGREVAKKFHMPFVDGLIRIHATAVQYGLLKEQQGKNMKDVFVWKDKALIAGKTVFLIDDIVTTGATFIEAAKVVKKAGAHRVYGIAFAGQK